MRLVITTGMIPVGAVWFTMGTRVWEDFPKEILNQAHEAGKKLVKFWKEKAKVPEAGKRLGSHLRRE